MEHETVAVADLAPDMVPGMTNYPRIIQLAERLVQSARASALHEVKLFVRNLCSEVGYTMPSEATRVLPAADTRSHEPIMVLENCRDECFAGEYYPMFTVKVMNGQSINERAHGMKVQIRLYDGFGRQIPLIKKPVPNVNPAEHFIQAELTSGTVDVSGVWMHSVSSKSGGRFTLVAELPEWKLTAKFSGIQVWSHRKKYNMDKSKRLLKAQQHQQQIQQSQKQKHLQQRLQQQAALSTSLFPHKLPHAAMSHSHIPRDSLDLLCQSPKLHQELQSLTESDSTQGTVSPTSQPLTIKPGVAISAPHVPSSMNALTLATEKLLSSTFPALTSPSSQTTQAALIQSTLQQPRPGAPSRPVPTHRISQPLTSQPSVIPGTQMHQPAPYLMSTSTPQASSRSQPIQSSYPQAIGPFSHHQPVFNPMVQAFVKSDSPTTDPLVQQFLASRSSIPVRNEEVQHS